MRIIYLITGIAILGIALTDLIWTTLWVDEGAGPISNRLTTYIWKFLRKISGNKGRILTLAGPIILVLILIMWVLLIWVGWAFLFSSDPTAISDSMDGDPITWYETLYFTGYSLFTLGNGNYEPKEGFWQILSALISGTGMLFLTLGASYIISIVELATQKRSLSSSIMGIGKNSEEMLSIAWNGKDFSRIDLLLVDFSTQLSALTQQHKAYPLLQYYHSEDPSQALAVAIAAWDEALTVMQYGVPEENQPNPVLLKEMRSTVQDFLEILELALIDPAETVPALPELASLRAIGIPVVSDKEYERNVSELDQRRKLTLGLIEMDAQEWPT